MKKLFTLFVLLYSFNGFGQVLPAFQPEQEPCNALEICGSFYTPYSYTGIGTTNNLPTTDCGAGEDNSVWFKLNVTTSGIMVFRIVPTVIEDDYDWALLDGSGVDCSSLGISDVIRCNFNQNVPVSFGGQTGLNMTSGLTSVYAGTTGSNFCKYVDVTAGEVYYLMVNNFGVDGGPTAGFNLDFEGSTATFNLPPAPKLLSILNPICEIKKTLRIKLDRLVKCSSIAANGSDFAIAPFGTIVSASGVDCGSSGSGFTDEINITFASMLLPADYTVSAATGIDGNTLLNLCDVPLVLPDQLNFTVYKVNDSVVMELCEGQLPYNWNGISVTGAGSSIVFTTDNVVGCDSMTRLFVSLVDTVKSTMNLTLCTNQMPYVWNGITLTTGGSPAATAYFVSSGGCDSLASLNLTVTPPKQVTATLSFCSYDLPQVWNGINIPVGASSNSNYDTFLTTTATGCDSFTILNLVINEITPIISATDTHACGSLTYKGITYYNDVVFGDTFRSVSGCDSAYITFNVFVHSNEPNIEMADWLACDSFTFRGKKYYENTVIKDTFRTPYGCDSMVMFNNINIQKFELALSADYEVLVDGEGLTLITSGNLSHDILSWTPAYFFPEQHRRDQYIKPNTTNTYRVIAKSENGCLDTASVKVEVVPLVPDMMMPTAFSPNGDGLNDEFRPVFYHETGYTINYFRIFNRWGNLVYVLENSRVKGWDGKNSFTGKDADSDVYFYIIEVEFVNGKKVTKKGDVTLLR